MASAGTERSFGVHARQLLPVVAAAVAIAWLASYVLPGRPRNPLVETTTWSLLVVVAFAGWGSLVKYVVARREHVDLGLRVVWGASALCALGGLLAVFAWMARGAVLLLVESGLVLAVAALVFERARLAARLQVLARQTRREPLLALVVVALAALVALHYVAGVADVRHHPYDDDIAYLAFVRKMLDTGTLLEPFSLRRLSSLGGQTFFLELVGVRAGASESNTFDRSISVLMIVLLIAGHRAQSRRLPWFVAVVTIALVLLLPSVAINTASYYSGVAFFLGLYRTVTWSGRRERKAWASALPIALVGAATCTLRQNYLLVAAAMLALMYGFRFFAAKGPLRWRLEETLCAAALSVLFLVPWFVLAWQSNRTFFYPVMLGTANAAMQFQSGSSTPMRELHLQLWTFLEGLPLKTLALFLVAGAIVREADPRKPLRSFLLGSIAGYVALVHGLTQGEPANIARYAFGFLMALAIAVVLSTTTTRVAFVLERPQVAAGLAIFGVLIGLVESRGELFKYYGRATRDIDDRYHCAPRSPDTDPPETALYQRLQRSAPEAARMAVLLDEPYHLDYARNPVWNLDMPGYSSLPPGMPYFQGSERVEAYLRGLGVRYVAYVREGYSRYQYRRQYWVQMIVDEQEVWRTQAPYVIDMVDNLAAIDARHRRAFDERGLVVIDLEAPR